jgi:Relaxase/Mobilisation nuclease domain
MIGKTTLSQSFESTLRYVYGKPDAALVNATLTAALTDDPIQIAQAMTAVANNRSAKPCYHISLSPAQGDSLSKQDWHRLSRDFLQTLGANCHQAVAVLHTDATYPDGSPRPHLHLVINRYASPDRTARALCLHFPTIERVIRTLEREYDLQSLACSWNVRQRSDAAPQYHRGKREKTASVRSQIQASIDQTIETAISPGDLIHKLQPQGISSHLQSNGIWFEQQGIALGGYQLGQRYTLEALESVLARNGSMLHDPVTPNSLSTRTGLSMAELMQAAQTTPASEQTAPQIEEVPLLEPSPPEEPSPEEPRIRQAAPRTSRLGTTGTLLDQLGQTVGNSQEIDGMWLGGAAAQLTGAGLTLADAFLQQLAAAKRQAQTERAQALLEQIEEVGQRTTLLEDRVQHRSAPAPDTAQTTSYNDFAATPVAGVKPQTVDPSVLSNKAESSADPITESFGLAQQRLVHLEHNKAESSADPITESFGLAQQRLVHLEQQVGLAPAQYTSLDLDRNLPIDDQLDQIEAALKQLSERLEKIEQALSPEATVMAVSMQPEQVAQSLANYVSARAQYYHLAPTEPVKTRTMGTIELSYRDGNEVIAVVEPPFGAKFEAIKQGDQWEVISNDLRAKEAETIVKLPQSVQEYESTTQNKALVRYFQQSAPQEFSKDQGKIIWNDQQNGFSYRFDIATDQSGRKTVIGIDQRTEKVVMKANLQSNGGIQIERAEIPKEHAQSLLHQQEAKPAESNVTSLRPKTRSKDRELSL